MDTHADVHVAAALDPIGGLLGVRGFPATTAGYARLLDWLAGFGTVALAGIEGTGSYGAGLARHMATAGVRVVEVDRSDRQDRRRQIMAQAVQIGQGGLGGYAAGPATRSGYLLAPLAWWYSSWRRNQLSGSPGPRASFRPRGARSSHWYMPQRPSRPRA